MRQTRIAIGTTLVLLLVVFTAQNTEIVTIRFLFWTLTLSRALLLFLVLAIGIVIGLLIGRRHDKPKRSDNG